MDSIAEPNWRSFAPITSDDKAGYVWIASIYGLVLSVMVMSIRVWYKRANFGKDDGLFVASTMIAMAHAICVFVALKHGLGTSPQSELQQTRTPNERGIARSSTIAAYMFLFAALTLAKCSTIMFVQRLLSRDMKRLIIACLASMLVMAIWGIASMAAVGTGCDIISFVANASCVGDDTTWVAVAAFDAATEVLLVVLPILVVWPLQLSFDLKIQVVVAFSFRLGVAALAITHAVYMHRAYSADRQGVAFVPAIVLAESELCWSLISATIPNLKAFMNIFNTGFGLNDIISSARGTVVNSSGSRLGGTDSSNAIRMKRIKSQHGPSSRLGSRLRPDHEAFAEIAVEVSRGHDMNDNHSIGSDNSQEMIIHKTVDHQVTYERKV